MDYSIGVISDTHGNLQLMAKVCNFLVEGWNVNEIFHLGDTYEDYKTLRDMGYPINGVPGLWDDEYLDKVTPKIIIKNICGKNFVFAHAKSVIERLDRKDLNIWCYGHTHVPEIIQENEIVCFNPGHLKKSNDRGNPATFGLVYFYTDRIEFKILNIENDIVQSLNYRLL